MLTFAVLGPLEVRRDGAPVALGPRRHAELLALLAARPRTVVPAEVLADQLWDGAPPPSATNTLQGYVAGLRRALEPDRGPREPARVLVTHPVGYLLDVADAALDVAVFRSRVAEARRTAAASAPGDDRLAVAVGTLREGLELWRGPALSDVADTSWAQPVVRALEEERLAAVELLADLRLAGEDLEGLVADLRRSLAENPWRERTAAQLVRALYRTGRQAEALDVARDTRAVLDDQLGIDLGPELRELELAVLRHDDVLLLPHGRPLGPAAAPAPAVPVAAAAPRLPGREAELTVLGRATARARTGCPSVVLVTGEAGIGKTRLVESATSALGDATVLTGRCTDLDGAPPYWPWRQVATLLGPGDDPTGDATGDPTGDLAGDLADGAVAAGRFEQALGVARRLRSAARDRLVVLVLEDLQWADAPSLQLLELVLGELHDAAVLVLLTSRVAGPAAPPALTRVLAALGRHPGAHRVELTGLDDRAVAACLAEVTGRDPGPTAATQVRRRAGGNPFFVRELARLLDVDGRVRPGVPAAVRDVIRWRASGLTAPARDLLAAGAVLGRDFSVGTVGAVLGLEGAAVVTLVEEVLTEGLLVEPVPGRLRFAHALVQEAVRDDLSEARAMTLHARAADALTDRERPPPGVLAHHLLRAHDPRCLEVAARAAALDLQQLAVEPALELVEQALGLTDLLPADPASVRELRLLRGLALGRLGRLDDAQADLVGVAEDAERAGDGDHLARAALGMAADGAVSGYWTTMAPVSGPAEEVVRWLRRALDTVALAPPTRVALRSALATQLAVVGRPDHALASSAVAEAEHGPLDRHSRTRALTARWATLWTPDHAAERLAVARRLLELAGPDVQHQLAARHLLATALLEAGDVLGSDAQAAALAATVADHRNPDFALLVVWWRAMRALMTGDLTGAEDAACELAAATSGVTGRAAATAAISSQTVAGIVAWERGLLGHATADLDVQALTSHPGIQAVRALAHAENGDPATAHRVLREAFGPRLERLGEDSTAVSPLVLGAEVLARAGDDGRAGVLLERLEPYAGAVVVFAPGAVCMGAGTLYTGTAAALAGDLRRARLDLEDAVERNSALGADPFTLRSLGRLAAVLERSGDSARASARRTEARGLATERGLPGTGMVLGGRAEAD